MPSDILSNHDVSGFDPMRLTDKSRHVIRTPVTGREYNVLDVRGWNFRYYLYSPHSRFNAVLGES